MDLYSIRENSQIQKGKKKMLMGKRFEQTLTKGIYGLKIETPKDV